MKNIHGMLLLSCSALALAGCGADDLSSPGNSGGVDVVINNPTPTPTPTPTSGTVVAASECPGKAATLTNNIALTDDGTISGPEGSWRVCTLPNLVSESMTLPKVAGVVYRLKGRTDVGCDGGFTAGNGAATTTAACAGKLMTQDDNVTLTIKPGVIVYGEDAAVNGISWLAVNRGNKIVADGTATNPIIFTATKNITGDATYTTQAEWGGVVLLGRGKLTDCDQGLALSNTCERNTEGSANPAVFGGIDNTYSAGSMHYFQIRYSGFALAAGKELQSLTGEGIGTGTSLGYFQSYNSSDDGSEWFGGAVNFDHYIAVNSDDDSLDLDTGVQANFQFGLLLQRHGQGDSFFEIDSDSKNTENGNPVVPRTKANIVNFTAYQPDVMYASTTGDNSNKASIMLRGNSDTTFVNSIFYSPNNECITMYGENPGPATLKAYGTQIACNAAKYLAVTASSGKASNIYTATDIANQFNSGNDGNSDTFTVTGTLNGFEITASGTAASPATIFPSIAFFTNTNYIGAISGASDTWYKGWTCDDADTAPFGSGSDCTALPTT